MAHKQMAETRIVYPSVDYDDQDLKPMPANRKLTIAIDLAHSADIEKLSVALKASAGSAERIILCGGLVHERMALQALCEEWCDCVGKQAAGGICGRIWCARSDWRRNRLCAVRRWTPDRCAEDAANRLMASGRPVTTAWIEGAGGEDHNRHAFTASGDLFKYLYRNGGREGAIREESSGTQRMPFNSFFALNMAPLTAAGPEFLLVSADVARAGVRFAETAYKYHTDAEGFCLMARDKGFEVCGMPGVRVRLGEGKGAS